jgi:hypothetical protein
MEIIAGVGYMFTASTITTAKLDITVAGFASGSSYIIESICAAELIQC